MAVSDLLLFTAQGVEVIRRTSLKQDLIRLQELTTAYEADTFLVGFPKNMNGTIGPRGEIVKQFVAELAAVFPRMIVKLWDERLSTVAAEKALIAANVSRAKRRTIIDKMAAVYILQGYLDSLPSQ